MASKIRGSRLGLWESRMANNADVRLEAAAEGRPVVHADPIPQAGRGSRGTIEVESTVGAGT
ncbi:hypothetical protein Ait01nite_084150 [Actinoplanes italicus]|nr:hypothetical protein Ait01nite_084150 [Actinoplanes italicus]